MALGRGMAGSVPDYIDMAQQADKAGMQDAQGIAGMMEKGFNLGSKMDDRDRMKQAREAFEGAWSSENPVDVQNVMAAFPEYASKIQSLLGVRDDQHRKDVGSMAVQLSGLLEDGNIQGAQDFIRQRKGLFDPSGLFSSDSVANAIGAAAQDPQKLQQWGNWANKLAMSTVTPEQALKHGEGERGLDLRELGLNNQFELGGERINLQRDLGNQRDQLGWARLNQMGDYRQQMLDRGTPAEREWTFFNNLAPDDQQKYLSMKRGPGAGGGVLQGKQTVQLSNGQTLSIDPKVHGAGSNAFYQGQDASGNLVNVPVSSVVTPVSSSEMAGQNAMSKDLDTILNSSADDQEHITGYARGGGTGQMPHGADTYTGYKGGTARDTFNSANRIQGNMQNKGIAAAKSMGASGINTVAEAKMYFQSMPQLDYSSPKSLIESAGKIREYTNQFNQGHAVSYPAKEGKTGVNGMSDDELLRGLNDGK